MKIKMKKIFNKVEITKKKYKQIKYLEKMLKLKKENINKETFNGHSELVDVIVNGKKEIVSLKIKDKESITADDLEILEDMIIIALNNAFKEVDNATESAMGSYGSALNGMF